MSLTMRVFLMLLFVFVFFPCFAAQLDTGTKPLFQTEGVVTEEGVVVLFCDVLCCVIDFETRTRQAQGRVRAYDDRLFSLSLSFSSE